MDQGTANHLFEQGAIFLILDLPQDLVLQFGIDLNSWKTGPKFKGLKLIPPGLHVIHYRFVLNFNSSSVHNRQGGSSMSSLQGFFKYFGKGEVMKLECE
jgi:A1 cistron-splicing factor AAR2